MAIINLVFLIIFACLWSSHHGRDTLKQGDTLNSSSSLVSASGNFTLSFVVKKIDGSNCSFLAIMRNRESANKAWIGNRNSPVLYPSSPLLTLDFNNTLKISQTDGDQDPIVICSAPHASNNNNTSVVATLLDSGNLVLQQVNSVDGSMNQVILWQSFDYPIDTLLPGMKLGVNNRNGHIWSLSSWSGVFNPAPGSFTLDWDPNQRQLKLRRKGVILQTIGVLKSDRRFEYTSDESLTNFKFSVVSNENEDSVTYTAAEGGSPLELVLYSTGSLYEYSSHRDVVQADKCDGNNTEGGCVGKDRPSECMKEFGGEFELKNGYFEPSNITNTSGELYLFGSSNTDCKATCWQSCDCLGFDFPISDNHTTGCRFWSVDCQFVENITGSGTTNGSFVLPRKSSTPTKPSSQNFIARKLWIVIAIPTALLVTLSCILYQLKRRKFSLSDENSRKIQNELRNFMRSNRRNDHGRGFRNYGRMGHSELSVFSYPSVLAATCNFCEENKLGQGGFGPVYKGKLVTGREIAVKRLSKCSAQGTLEFKNELILISELQHTNLVQLLGFCIHGEERMLIYEYMPNKSLDNFLFDSTRALLDWTKRFSIIEGIAQGLLYLHKYSRMRVIHRDLKTSNILLDENMNPKISDFGMARIFTDNELEANTGRIVGTRGYMSPEYAMEGIFSIKSDVFSFGVLMLEIISGRKNNSFYNDERVLNLVGYTWELWKEGAGIELMDPTLTDSCIRDQFLRCIHVGLLCVEQNAGDRPTISSVISMLTNESVALPMPTKPAFFTERNHVAGGKEPEDMSINCLSNSDIVAR
ncbi:G-type lectin S-receptor-like serine/threonine-protein kinase CES101 [Malus sylvestris]|uniref:G-type lectin S-receptor-like serine/threonine-protein kinase CES101 n=1 Tax=Malus sylvestris TaxID=3752 RepID=UPI0021ABC9CB|nr:G-type lectin S-receptor-like serine/threonine-protein kinase CES101 [Malus sylvestris]